MKPLTFPILCLILLLLTNTMVLCEAEQRNTQDDDEDFIATDFKSLEEKDSMSIEQEVESTEKLRPMGNTENFQYMEEQVKNTIGVNEDNIDEKGQAIPEPDLTNLKRVLNHNRNWTKQKIKEDPDFFLKHHPSQKPTYLWIGCSDSRIPANQILGLSFGELFVLRNVANIVSPSDISSLAVIQYAVEVLKVTDILVAGHYGCGGVKAAVTKYNHGPLEAWLSKLRRMRHKHAHAFQNLTSIDEQANLLVEINVKEQVFNVASTPFVQQAWKDGQQLRIHGVVYDMQTGRLVDMKMTMHHIDQLPDQLAIFQK